MPQLLWALEIIGHHYHVTSCPLIMKEWTTTKNLNNFSRLNTPLTFITIIYQPKNDALQQRKSMFSSPENGWFSIMTIAKVWCMPQNYVRDYKFSQWQLSEVLYRELKDRIQFRTNTYQPYSNLWLFYHKCNTRTAW